MALGQFLPPILHRQLVRWRAAREPVFPSYQAAVSSRGEDYHDEELVDVVFSKTKRLLDSGSLDHVGDHQLMSTLLAVAVASSRGNRGAEPLRVLDFGGALGTSYHLTKGKLPGAYAWAVVETPYFVEAGKRIETSEIRFFETTAEATAWLGEVDLIYSSSAVQYMPDPLATIDDFIASRAGCIALLRSAFSEGRQVVVLQESRLRDNGPGPLPAGVKDRPVYYPRTYASLPAVRERFAHDYELVLEVGDGTPRLTVGGEAIAFGGNYLFRRRGNA